MRSRRLWTSALLLLTLFLTLPFAMASEGEPTSLRTLEDLQAYFGAGKALGVRVGTIQDGVTQKYFPEAERVYVSGTADLIAALSAGKIDGYLDDKPQGYAQTLTNDDLWMPDIEIEADRYGIAMAFGNEALCAKIDEVIVRLKAEGELARLSEKWFLMDETVKLMPEEPLTGENGTLRLITSADGYPFIYVRDGEIVGYEIELFDRICRELGYDYTIQNAEFAGVIAAVSTGKADAAVSCISITEERKEQMLFSESTYDGGVIMMLPASLRARFDSDAGSLESADAIAQWMVGKRIGLYIGSDLSVEEEALVANSEHVWLNTYADMSVAIDTNKIDGFLCEAPIAQQICWANDELYTPGIRLSTEEYAFAMRPGREELADQLNATIRRLQADGTLDRLQTKWAMGDASEIKMPNIKLTGENGVIRIATDAADAPFGYIMDDEMVGYDYELLTLFAQEHGYALEYAQMAWDALPAAIMSGKYDIACGCLTKSDDHAESVLFSDTTFVGGQTIVVSDKYAPVAVEKPAETGLRAVWTSVCASFERTFIRENRWKLILEGLWTTVLISVLSVLLGTVLGFGVCMMRRSRIGIVSGIARVFIQIMQGVPIVVFLMVLYFVVFGDVEPILVAVIGFALNFAAYVSEMMRTGIDAVDKGQIEAASAIGFTKARAFFLITFPQAARHFLPVFRGEVISLVKMTSVVGYITIVDLTKMSDIIRSRTYEAFFPLIATALIYFLLSWGLAQGLAAIELRVDPKRKKRVVKGVREEETAS